MVENPGYIWYDLYMTANKVVIMRSISGGGKSTYVRKHFPGAVVCSADHFFDQKDGSYKFNPKLLSVAHKVCSTKFGKALKSKKPLIVVDNTNTTMREIRPYMMAAKAAGYEVDVVRIDTPVDVAHKRNAHGVPLEAIQRMADRMAPAPKEWNEMVVSGTE